MPTTELHVNLILYMINYISGNCENSFIDLFCGVHDGHGHF